jgi:hypothetical protein
MGLRDLVFGRRRGKIVLGSEPAVPLVLAGGRLSPSEAVLRLARELPARYPSLQPTIALALFEHYAPYAEAIAAGEEQAPPGLPTLTAPDQVWGYVSPVRVWIGRIGGVETVEIAYRAAWDDEHTLGSRFQGWRLVELNGSVRP